MPDNETRSPLPFARNTPPPFPQAVDQSTYNPTVQQRRISALVSGAARTLFGLGERPHTLFRVIHTEQPHADKEAA